jgi:hypothetical protein
LGDNQIAFDFVVALDRFFCPPKLDFSLEAEEWRRNEELSVPGRQAISVGEKVFEESHQPDQSTVSQRGCYMEKNLAGVGLPDFSWCMSPKPEKCNK